MRRSDFGKPALTADQFAYAHQHTVYESIAHFFKEKESIDAVHAYRQKMDYGAFLKLLTVEPDLGRSPRRDPASDPPDTMDRLLAEFNLTAYFDLVVTSFDVARPKPHPDVLQKVLSHFSIRPQEALYVGDSQVDVEAANAANIPFVAYRNKTLQTPYHITTLKELQGFLEV